jgi:2'-5' RNA ligase
MPRYFVALALPDEAKDRLLAIQPPAVPGSRLPGREELHLTLHFLGEVDAQRAPAVRNALAGVRADAFSITLQGVGRFPPDGLPRVLWAGVESHPSLIALHRTVGIALADAIGFRPEDRPYSPHVALAYLNSPPPPGTVERYLAETGGFRVAPVHVRRFALYTSTMAEDRPRYQEEAVFDLLPPEAPD